MLHVYKFLEYVNKYLKNYSYIFCKDLNLISKIEENGTFVKGLSTTSVAKPTFEIEN